MYHTTLALTISPPKRTNGKDYIEPNKIYLLEDVMVIRQIFEYNRIGRYILFPEFDGKGRLHYHGTVTLDANQYVRFYKHAMHKLGKIGFVDFKKLQTFEDKLRWSIYCKKDWGISKEILSIQNPILKESKVGENINMKIRKTDWDKRTGIKPNLYDYFIAYQTSK